MRYQLEFTLGAWTVVDTLEQRESGNFRTWKAAQRLANKLNGESVKGCGAREP